MRLSASSESPPELEELSLDVPLEEGPGSPLGEPPLGWSALSTHSTKRSIRFPSPEPLPEAKDSRDSGEAPAPRPTQPAAT